MIVLSAPTSCRVVTLLTIGLVGLWVVRGLWLYRAVLRPLPAGLAWLMRRI